MPQASILVFIAPVSLRVASSCHGVLGSCMRNIFPLHFSFVPLFMNSSQTPVLLQYSPLVIRLNDLHFYAHHGVLPQERVVGGRFTLQILLELASSLAALEHDQLEGTVSYADVYELAKEVMAQPSQLLEHVASTFIETTLTVTFPTSATCHRGSAKRQSPHGGRPPRMQRASLCHACR